MLKNLHPKYISGETLRYLGQRYTLHIRHTAIEERVVLEAETITVFSFLTVHRARTRSLLDNWYAVQACAVFQSRLQLCAALFGLQTPPALAIRRMTSRWGSYSRRTHRICMNLELIKTDLKQIDYILIHELCHITQGAHDKAFYQLLSQHRPEWKRLKAELAAALLSGE